MIDREVMDRREGRLAGIKDHGATRRQFFLGTGLAAGTLAGLGLDLKPAAAPVPKLKMKGSREVSSICPDRAVGCSQIVRVRDGQIVDIEGNPDSPINRGTLRPKGAATFQVAVNDQRPTKVKYRAPHSKEWVEKDLDWAMDRIAERLKATRDATISEIWKGMDAAGKPIEKRVNHCTTIASLGGATMDRELAVRRQAPPRADQPNLDCVAITIPRASIRAQALVTRRIRPFLIDGRTTYHVGMPWHWGYNWDHQGRRHQRPLRAGR